MTSLKDAEQMTKKLESLVGDLKTELREGKGDFEKLAQLADKVSESADGFAETFSSLNDTLSQRIKEIDGSGDSGGSRQSSGSRERSGSKS